MVSIGIYKITSPTHRIYIGQSINIEQRWKGYSITKLKSQPKINSCCNNKVKTCGGFIFKFK